MKFKKLIIKKQSIKKNQLNFSYFLILYKRNILISYHNKIMEIKSK